LAFILASVLSWCESIFFLKYFSHQLLHVYGCLTNNGLWTERLDLLTPSFTISINHNQLW
jgi:hypothetical protein